MTDNPEIDAMIDKELSEHDAVMASLRVKLAKAAGLTDRELDMLGLQSKPLAADRKAARLAARLAEREAEREAAKAEKQERAAEAKRAKTETLAEVETDGPSV